MTEIVKQEARDGIPIYLDNRTLIGYGTVSADGRTVVIDIQSDSPIAELMSENLIGFSTVTLAADRAEDIINKNKEKTDD